MKGADHTIIVVGAGAAGLMAARRLSEKYKVIVLEGNDRIGGRIYTMNAPGFTRPIEAGAEFIHGNLPLTLRLLKEAGIKYHEIRGNFYRSAGTGLQGQFELFRHWGQLLEKMEKEKQDMTLSEFLQKNYAAEAHHEFREQIRGYAEGFDAADIAKASMKTLYKEWSNEDREVYRISGGYGQLIDWLVHECRKNGAEIVTGSFVTQVDWKRNKVTVVTKENKHYTGEKCIITIPIVLLQETKTGSIHFKPSLNDHIEAARDIGYSTVIKIVIEFSETFWNRYAKGIGFIIGSGKIPTWWTQLPDPVPLLTGWKGGPGATALSEKSDEEILAIAMNSLSAIFKIPEHELKQKLIAAKVFNWLHEEFSKGAYSYAYLSSENAMKLLNTPVDNTIFFAGEALHTEGSLGTVEAALATGEKIATKLKMQND